VPGFIEEKEILMFASEFNVLQHILLFGVCENPDSHRYVVGSKRSILTDFPENFGYSS